MARMSARFVSIRRKRSRAWSSRRRDRRPRRRLLYLASREASSLTGSSPEARGRDALEGLELVHPLIVADLTEEIGDRGEAPVVVGEDALERLGLERGVLRDVVHVLVLCAVLEPGVDEAPPARSRHVQQPGEVAVHEGKNLRDH